MDDTKLEDIVAFLAEYQWIFRHSNTRFIKAGALEDFPKHWAESLMLLSHGDLNEIPFGKIPDSLSRDLRDFLERIHKLSITVPSAFEEKPQVKPIRGINPKKLQEISSLSWQIHQICKRKGIEYLVDLGSGLGYLCQMLHERFSYKILGLECDEERVKTARKRQEKFFPISREAVKFVQHFITPSSWEFIADELKTAFHVDPSRTPVALVGLHACGDLTVTSVKLFECTATIQCAIVMPCCYHKMSIDANKPLNFPLSGRLMDILGKIPARDGITCRPFLRLACQQPASRWKRMTEEEHKIHGKNMFRRALLDALVEEGQEVVRMKKCGERVTTEDFEGAICGFEIRDSNTGGTIPWNTAHRSKWWSLCVKYPRGGELAECLTLLQTTIQELCENLILIDRKLYVEENVGFSCNLIKILDEDTSPRCIVLIAAKS